MRTTNIGKHVVTLYDGIDELPMQRFHKYNKCLLIDSGIGSDLSDFDRHIEKAMLYAKSKTPELVIPELENLRHNVYFIQSGISPKHLSFAVLVQKIDGKPCNDLSDDGLAHVLELLGDAPNDELTAQLEAVKKKIDNELQLYFPSLFDDSTAKEYFDELRQRTLAVLDAIANGMTEEKQAVIDQLTTELMLYSKPKVFSGTKSAEIEYDKQYETMCLTLSQNLHIDPKNKTVLEFYNAFEYLKKQMKQYKAK